MPLRAPKGFIDESDPKVCQIGHPAPPWLVNYADLMTELVCFFVILYALSAALNKNVQNAKNQVDEMIKEKKVAGETEVNKQGLKVTLEEKGGSSFFTSGAAETTAEIDSKIQELAPVLKPLVATNDLLIEGHTDSQRISNEFFDSNWELSTARATAVARLLVDKYGFPPEHVGAVGYGDNRPIAPNDTPEGRARNRRVVFFISAENSKIPLKGRGGSAASQPAPPAGATEPSGANSVPLGPETKLGEPAGNKP